MSDYFNGTGTIGFTCDNCGRELLGCTWVNGMKFCAKCYQETFGTNTKEITHVYGGNLKEHIKVIEEKDKKIADLETKLAESETRIEELESQFAYECECNKQFVDCQNENAQLKQQLAEKEKESLKYFNEYRAWKSKCELLEQDQISFAVEQLEKVKELLNEYKWWQNPDEDGFVFNDYAVDWSNVIKIIDNQIKTIKEIK